MIRLAASAAAILMLVPLDAQARKFDFKNESFAIQFGGTFGPSRVSDTAYSSAVGDGTIIDTKGVQTNSSGGIGVLFSGTRFNFKLAVEYLMPRDQVGVIGTNAGGTDLFTMDSKLSALVPTASIELQAYRGTRSRAILGGSYGLAFVSLDNDVTMTAAGTAAFGGVGSFKESATAKAPMLEAYAGLEFLMTDVVTLTLSGGYRYLPVRGFKSIKETRALSGNQTDGGDILNMDGGDRYVDMGGGFIGAHFRFYVAM
jgi:hypothetical protein